MKKKFSFKKFVEELRTIITSLIIGVLFFLSILFAIAGFNLAAILFFIMVILTIIEYHYVSAIKRQQNKVSLEEIILFEKFRQPKNLKKSDEGLNNE